LLGHLDDGREFSLAIRGRNVLVTGDAKSGKSWIAGLLSEQLILHGYSVCAIDPEGDYSSLESLPGVTVLGREDAPPTPRELLRALRYPDRSVVIDLSRLPHDEKLQAGTSSGAIFRAGLPTCSAIAPWPPSSARWRINIGPGCAMKRSPKWRTPFAADMTWRKTSWSPLTAENSPYVLKDSARTQRRVR
jgi:Helicase HerA, central domain